MLRYRSKPRKYRRFNNPNLKVDLKAAKMQRRKKNTMATIPGSIVQNDNAEHLDGIGASDGDGDDGDGDDRDRGSRPSSFYKACKLKPSKESSERQKQFAEFWSMKLDVLASMKSTRYKNNMRGLGQ